MELRESHGNGWRERRKNKIQSLDAETYGGKKEFGLKNVEDKTA